METGYRKLRAWREAAGFTQRDCAGLTGLSAPFWTRLELGQRRLPAAEKVRVARCLDAAVADLFEPEVAAVEQETVAV